MNTEANPSGLAPLESFRRKNRVVRGLVKTLGLHSTNTSFKLGCMGSGLADASVFVLFRLSPRRQ
jgi:hypothetical protein